MKKKLLIQLCILICTYSFGQEGKVIDAIREKFQKWQPVVKDELKTSTKFYHYVWGEHYRNDEWCSSETYDEDKLLCQIASVIEDINLGTYVHYDNYSISGDWHISSDYYFNKDNNLYFVFWRMNTYQAEEPLTVEKRLYFNFDGEPIRTIQTKYKMNTINKSNASFADQNVEYKSRLNRMGFYNTWKNK